MVWCRFGSWSLVIKSFFVQTSSTRFGQNFEVLRQDFEAEVAADPWLRLWRLFLVEILRLRLVKILKFKISRNADIWLMFWSCCLVEIMKMKSNQDLFENLWYDLKKLLWWAELNPRVRCAFGNVFHMGHWLQMLMTSDWCLEQRRGDTSEALFAGYNGDENAHVFGPPGHSPSNLHHFPSWFWQPWKFK